MSNKRELAVELRTKGLKHREIAEQLGVSSQRVSQLLSGQYADRKVHRAVTPKTCDYPKLRAWINANVPSFGEFVQLMGYEYCPKTMARIRRRLTTSKNALTMREIRRILEVTGMTFEECFGEGEA